MSQPFTKGTAIEQYKQLLQIIYILTIHAQIDYLCMYILIHSGCNHTHQIINTIQVASEGLLLQNSYNDIASTETWPRASLMILFY